MSSVDQKNLEAIRLEREDCKSNLSLGGLLAGFAFVGVVELSKGERQGILVTIALGSCIVATLALLTSTMLTNIMITELAKLEHVLRSGSQKIQYTPFKASDNNLYGLSYFLGLAAIMLAIVMMSFFYSIFIGVIAVVAVVLALVVFGSVAVTWTDFGSGKGESN